MPQLTDREILIAYLFMKARQEDWHGVRDCAVDIEIHDAKNSCKCRPTPLASDPEAGHEKALLPGDGGKATA